MTAAAGIGIVVAPSGVLVVLTLLGVLALLLPSSPLAGAACGDCYSCTHIVAV